MLDLKPEINNNLSKSKSPTVSQNEAENKELKFYKTKLKESEAKVEELVEVCGKLR
jgi:hypothetical protein